MEEHLFPPPFQLCDGRLALQNEGDVSSPANPGSASVSAKSSNNEKMRAYRMGRLLMGYSQEVVVRATFSIRMPALFSFLCAAH